MDKNTFSVVGRLTSFKYAIAGIWTMLKYEHNAWLHAVATVIVVVLGLRVGLDRFEWCWVVLAIAGVWMAEALNTSLEFLADVAVPDIHPMVEKAKDVAAGAVLINSAAAVVIAVLVFIPHFK
jgi:diacylglycerol kinase (ATP)